MSKIAIASDTNSGISRELAQELGVYLVSMPFSIDDKTYYEGMNLSEEEFHEKQVGGARIFTSQPAIPDVTRLWDAALEDHDEVVYIPMSSGLSGSCGTAMMLAQDEDYEGRVFVPDLQRVSITQYQAVLDALALAKMGLPGATIAHILTENRGRSSIYLTVEDLAYLKRGGRITPTAAALGSMLNIKPVLQLHGEKLEAYSKCRGMKAAKRIMLEALKHDLEEAFPEGYTPADLHLGIAYAGCREEADALAKEMEEMFPGFTIIRANLPLSLVCHVGPGTLGIGWSGTIPELR
jgi:DegV family protein with EDD domain